MKMVVGLLTLIGLITIFLLWMVLFSDIHIIFKLVILATTSTLIKITFNELRKNDFLGNNKK